MGKEIAQSSLGTGVEISPVWRILAPWVGAFITFTVTLVLSTIVMMVLAGPHSELSISEVAIPFVVAIAFLVPVGLAATVWWLVRRRVNR